MKKLDDVPIENMNDEQYEKYFEEKMGLLIDKCKNLNIEFEKSEFEKSNAIDELYWIIKLPAGREKKRLCINEPDEVDDLLKIKIEDYICINDYAAICSYNQGIIEAYIKMSIPTTLVKKRLFLTETETDEELCITINQISELGNIKVKIGKPSFEISHLIRFSQNSLTIRIEEIDVKSYDRAISILEKISNAIFFQIDLRKNLALTLARESKRRVTSSSRGMDNRLEEEHYTFPNTLYDMEPVALYWYARNSNGIPLLQYLAYYQSIEFYFPVYSEIEAKKRIKNVLKNPTFDPNDENHLAKVLACVKSNIGKNFDSEKTQLKSTLKECVNVSDLRKFINKNKYISDFFTTNYNKKISKHKVNLSINNDDEFLNIIFERIYEIRCKIVHTKTPDEENIEVLLPFSKEAEDLIYDIEIIKYISQQVICYNGKSFNL